MTFTISENPHRTIKHSVRPPVDSYRILAPQDPNRSRKPFGAARKAPPRRAKPAAAPSAPGVNDENQSRWWQGLGASREATRQKLNHRLRVPVVL